MTKLEEMTRAFIAAELRRLQKGPVPTVYIDRIYPESVPSMAEALKVLREANTAMKTAGVVSKDRYGSVADIFESMIDTVLAEAPK